MISRLVKTITIISLLLLGSQLALAAFDPNTAFGTNNVIEHKADYEKETTGGGGSKKLALFCRKNALLYRGPQE